MTTRLVVFALASLVPAAAAAQHFHHHIELAPGGVSVCDDNRYTKPDLDPNKQGVDWKVTSVSEEAKQHFRQGLTLYYGFNYEDALRNFRRASELDKDFVMGWWGMALAAGPNININIDKSCLDQAQTWSAEAWRLAQHPVKPLDSVEFELARALTVRYTAAGVQAEAYAKEMEGVWTNRRTHPQVAALYAESLMDLHPWALWDKDHKQTSSDTQRVLDVLTAVKDGADALGANHYWIHAVEAGPDPGSAKESAMRLDTAVKGSGHLLHMPSHTYFLTGRYADAVAANKRAIDEDFKQFEAPPGKPCAGDYATYIKNLSCQPLYYGHYYSHNLFFRAVSNAFLGQNQAALDDALATRAHAARFVPNEPGLQRYMTAPYLLYAAFGGWKPILDPKETEPSCDTLTPSGRNAGCHIARAAWRWARGMAYTTQPKDLAAARAEQALFRRHHNAIWTSGPNSWGNNKAVDVLAIADEVLQARIAWADDDRDGAIARLKTAVANEDALIYDEPPQWVLPARQSLGGAYLARGRKQDFEEAVKVFCIDLREHRENGRSLYGLARALWELGNTEWSSVYGTRYIAAWPEHWLRDSDLWLLGWPAKPGSGNDAAGNDAVANPDEQRFGAAPAAAPDPKTDPCLKVPSAG